MRRRTGDAPANKSASRWQATLDDALRTLGSVKFDEATDSDARALLQREVSSLREAYMDRRVPAMFEKLSSLIENLDSFSRCIDVYANADTRIGAVVWGSLRLLLNMCKRYMDVLNEIIDMLEKIDRRMPRFEAYTGMFQDSPRLEARFAEFHAIFVAFCMATIRFMKRRPCWAVLRLTWSEERRIFRCAETDADKISAEIEAEANASHMGANIVQSTLLDERTEKILKIVQADDTAGKIEPNLPCRSIPFNENLRFFERPTISDEIEATLIKRTKAISATSTSRSRSFLLHGVGGVGKTQLAVRYVYRNLESYDVIFWIEAETEDTLAKGFAEAAELLGISRAANQSLARQMLRKWLQTAGVRWLLVFDNAEDPATLSEQYWPQSQQGDILISSRNSLFRGLASNHWPVGPLERDEGCRMLVGFLEHRYPADDDAMAVAEELCGLPLAIRQMSGYILESGRSLSQFLTEYRKPGRAADFARSTSSIGLHGYKYTLEMSFRLSMGTLSSDAKDILGVCVFVNPTEIPESLFTEGSTGVHGMEAFGDVLRFHEASQRLIRQSLVKRNVETSMLDLHRLVQRRGIEDSISGVRVRNFHNAAQLLFNVFPRQCPIGGPMPKWSECDKYRSHVLALLNAYNAYMIDDALVSTRQILAELFCDCGVYLWTRGLYKQSQQLVEASICLSDAVLPAGHTLRAQSRTTLGCIYLYLDGRNRDALAQLERALQIRIEYADHHDQDSAPRYNRFEDDIQLANGYSNLGVVAKNLGNYEEAARLHHLALEIKNRWPLDEAMAFITALSYEQLGKVRMAQGLLDLAARDFTRAFGIMTDHSSRDSGNLHRAAQFESCLGRAELELGHYDLALEHLLAAERVFRETVGPGHKDTGLVCHLLGRLSHQQRKPEEAKRYLKDAIKAFAAVTEYSSAKLARSLHMLALVESASGELEQATRLKAQADELYRLAKMTSPPTSLDEASTCVFESLVDCD